MSCWNGKQSFRRLARHEAGNDADVVVDERGNIEIAPKTKAHRRVKPEKGITFDSLFEGYEPSDKPSDYSSPWLGDDLSGAEHEAWSR